jgi:UDP-GlcNAc:undecaprenyl-phosphate GlcNAc-1-phosphate transferase
VTSAQLWRLLGWYGAAFAITVMVTPIVRLAALRWGVVARPKADRWHRGDIPMLGGIAIAAGILLPLFANRPSASDLRVMLVGVAMFGLGLVDDVLRIRPGTKLLFQIALACILITSGASAMWVGSPAIDAVLSILWFVGLTNAFNLLDNMDGLCAGIAAIAAIALAFSGRGGEMLLPWAALVAGASSAFLVFNFQPASVFMGDCGSLLLGSTLATLGLMEERALNGRVMSTISVPLIVMLIPIFDTTFVTVSRKLSGRAASTGGRDHTSHRLVALGYSERQAVLVLYALAAAGGAAAVAVARLNPGAVSLGVAVLVVLLLLGVRLARVAVYGGSDYSRLREGRITPLLVEFTYKRRVFEVLLDILLISIAYYTAYLLRFGRELPIYYPLFVRSLPIVIGCHVTGFFLSGVYRGIWRFIALHDLPVFVRAITAGGVLTLLVLVYAYRFDQYPRSVFVLNAVLLGAFVVGSRVFFRGIGELAGQGGPGRRPALIYGAGRAGTLLVRELRENPAHDAAVLGFIDDDPAKQTSRILGVSVLGSAAELPDLIARHKIELLIVSTDAIPAERLDSVLRVCQRSGTALLCFSMRLTPLDPMTRAG